MSAYQVTFEDALSTGFLTAGALIRGASKRAFLDEIFVSINGTMSDEVADWRIRRLTADGTGSAVTPNPVDSADGASVTTAKENYTIEGTYTANSELLEESIHRRAAYRWIAQPGRALVIPNTAGAGLGCEVLAPSAAGNFRGTFGFTE